MTIIPRHALSIRQPWAWAILHAGKDIENRNWHRPNPGLSFRGAFAIHAAQSMTLREYESAAATIEDITDGAVVVPFPNNLQRGGIVGVATVVDIVKQSDSPWFFGRLGLVLADVQPVDFVRAAGRLGFFEWSPINDERPPVANWMRTWGRDKADWRDATIQGEMEV